MSAPYLHPDQPDRLPVVHIAGLVINLGGHLRQRCAWCGALIDDVELALTAVAVVPGRPADTRYPTWPEGGLVAVDGGARWTVESTPLPPGLCAHLDPEVTA